MIRDRCLDAPVPVSSRGDTEGLHKRLEERSQRAPHPYSLLRPLAPPREAAPRRELVHNEGAHTRRSVRLAVDEALLGDGALAGAAKRDGPDDGKPVEDVS